MKSSHLPPAVLFLALIASLPGFAAPAAPHSASPAATTTKPYMLYVGADFFVQRQGKLCPVKGVDEKGFVVDVDGRRIILSSDREDLQIQAHTAVKVAPSGITISQFKPERAYTRTADPNRQWEKAVDNANQMSAKMESNRYNADVQSLRIAQLNSAVPTKFGPDPMTERQLYLPAVSSDYRNTHTTILNDQGSAMQDLTVPGNAGPAAADRHDAFELTFDIASRTPQQGVYLVLAVRTRKPAEKAGSERTWIIGQNVGDISPKAKTVQVFRGGYPPGYTLVGVQAHFYRDGVELATNVAPMHAAITGDEAFRIALADYIGHHRSADTQPVQASSPLPDSVRARLGADELNRTYYVKVGKDGHPTGAYLDQACTRRVTDESLASAFAAMRFYPALKAGKPVDAVAAVRL